MSHRKTFLALSTVLVISLPLAAQQNQITPVAVADLSPTSNLVQQKVGPDDLIGIQVYDAPEFTRTVRVSAGGTIQMAGLHDPIRVQGLMPDDISVLVKEALIREQLYVDPFVTTTVMEYHSRPISVTGQVRTPTIFQAIGNVTLLDALARAGGILTDQAGAEIIVTRPNGDTGTQSIQRIPIKPLMSSSQPELNIKLVGGEEVRVPDVEKFIVAGSVVHPGPYPVLDGNANTVMTAIAQAQGTIQFYDHTVYIYRPDPTDPTGARHEIAVDLGKIQSRKIPDVALQARDVLWVPDSSRRRITANLLTTLTNVGAAATSASIYVLR
jgi:polysaccharide export outer membrane protein